MGIRHGITTRLYQVILPRPLGLQHKGLFFWIGFVFSYPFYAAALASSNVVGTSLLRGLLFFVALEILVQQAKFLWNDVRDRRADLAAGINQERTQLSSVISDRAAMLHVIVRWLSGLIIGALLSPSLLIVLLAISLHQIFYEFAVKPQSKRHPVIYLAFLSFNLPLRALCGMVCFFEGTAVLNSPILLISLFILYLLSWSSLSNQALTEAHRAAGDTWFTRYVYLRQPRWLSMRGAPQFWRRGDRRPTPAARFPRGHSLFFYENGRRMAALVLFPSLVIALLLTFRLGGMAQPITLFLGAVLLVIGLGLLPVTLRDVGFGSRKAEWYPILRATVPLLFIAVILLAVYTLIAAAVEGGLWFLTLYTFLHYLLYVDAPPETAG